MHQINYLKEKKLILLFLVLGKPRMLIRDSRFEIQSTKATNQENASKL